MFKYLKISASLIFLILFLSKYASAEEQITITTYYPSPYGSYRDLEVQGDLIVSKSSTDGETGRIRFVGNYLGGADLDALIIEKIDDDRTVEGGMAFVLTTSNGTNVSRQDPQWAAGTSLNAMVIRGENSGGVLTGANVGIGTTNPQRRLEVIANAPAAGFVVLGRNLSGPSSGQPDTGGVVGQTWGDATSPMAYGILGRAANLSGLDWKMGVYGFAPEAATNFAGYFQGKTAIMDSATGSDDGRLGIKTTNPQAPLHTNGFGPTSGSVLYPSLAIFDSDIGNTTWTGGIARFITLAYNNDPLVRMGYHGSSVAGNGSLGKFWINVNESEVNPWTTADFVINSGGNVGIKTTVPKVDLEVTSVIKMTPTDSPVTGPGAPTAAQLEGSMYYDNSEDVIKYHDPTAWVTLATADGSGYARTRYFSVGPPVADCNAAGEAGRIAVGPGRNVWVCNGVSGWEKNSGA